MEKYTLVPQELMPSNATLPDAAPPHGTVREHLSLLDNEMQMVMKYKDLPDDIKARLYHDTLMKFLDVKHDSERPILV